MIEFDFDDGKLDRKMRVRIWEAGTRIGTSWMLYGDKRQKRLQIESRGTPASLVYQKLMLAEICSRIAGRQFVALGYCRIPQSDSPIFIPADLFNGTGVANGNDILDDIVVARGMSYEGVKILPCKHALAIAHIGAEITGTATFQDVAKNTQRKRGGSGPNRLGRPSVKDAIHELIAHLSDDPEFQKCKRKNAKARLIHRLGVEQNRRGFTADAPTFGVIVKYLNQTPSGQ